MSTQTSSRSYKYLILAICEAMQARADGDLLASPPEGLPPELAHLVQVWLRTLEFTAFDSDRIHDMVLPMVVVDGERHTIKSLNRAALRLFRYENAGELVYETVERLVQSTGALDGLSRATDVREIIGRRKDRSTFHVEAELVAEADDADRIIAFRDITDRKVMEAAMEQARDTALRTARLQAHFLANMSHEIRTPVNGILGMTELLLDSELQPEQHQHAEAIKQSGETLLTLINDILDLSKIESGKMTLDARPTDVRQVVGDVMTLMGPKADDQGNQLVIDYPEGVPSFFNVDPVRVRQVLTNLVGNAVKFTQNGRVEVRARVVESGTTMCHLSFAVVDTGIGIPADKLNTIFDKFTQAESSTTRRYGGTGLGLSICKQVVTLMGGTLRVQSAVGRGSAFDFTIPAELSSPDEMRAGDAMRERADARDMTGLRVLVAEDNTINQMIARRTLEKLGCIVTIVDNGADAARTAAQHNFDIVFMDCMMPGTDGYEGTRRIRAHEQGQARRRLPIVALTAKAMKGDREACIEAGMDDYLTKPFNTQGLRLLIERWCFAEARARSRSG